MAKNMFRKILNRVNFKKAGTKSIRRFSYRYEDELCKLFNMGVSDLDRMTIIEIKQCLIIKTQGATRCLGG